MSEHLYNIGPSLAACFAKGIVQARNSLNLIYAICTSFKYAREETREREIYDKRTKGSISKKAT